ncbi:MAG TPA: hypothetical protein VGI12_04675 [Vicinamibacterales bacterium]|jgi:hypothetical protein
MAALVPGPRRDDDIDALGARLADLERALAAGRDGAVRAQHQLAAFRLRYRRDVGLLHEELEELERAIAELEIGEFARRLDEEGGGTRTAEASVPAAGSTRALTSDAVRRLFRDVAKAIHPDLGEDDAARDRRHALMVEANRAYAMGDEARLRRILQAWETAPEAVLGEDVDAARERLLRRIAQAEQQLAVCEGELAELHESPLWKLRAMVDQAAARGKDLIAEQVRRLKRDIVAARNRLDAMRL